MIILKSFENFKLEGITFMGWLSENYPEPDPITGHCWVMWDTLKKIHCHNKELTDLIGVEKLINLEELYCSRNLITSLKGIENSIKIRALYCSDNLISNLMGIENLHNLEKLFVDLNNLKDLEFSKYSIDAFELGIDETDLRKFKKLNFLSCWRNQFSNEYTKYIIEYCKRKKIELYD